MGIGKKIIDFENESLREAYLDYSQICICEMGNQEYKGEERMPAKEYYKNHLHVKEHISFDLNNQWGALEYDLTEELPSEFHNRFDVVTNYGTGEHVPDQYEFYANCHRVCKQNGLIINFIPHEGFWPGHGRFYFNQDTVWDMAEVFGYKILNYKNVRLHDNQEQTEGILVCYVNGLNKHVERDDFDIIDIVDTMNYSGTGVDYDHRHLDREYNV
jgi:SAM-dependent methyltransferase